MIVNIFDFVMEYIVGPFMICLLIGFVGLCIVGLFLIPSCIKEEQEQERQLEECFKQEPRTKDCEYMIWQYEIKNSKPKHTTIAVPVVMPIVR